MSVWWEWSGGCVLRFVLGVKDRSGNGWRVRLDVWIGLNGTLWARDGTFWAREEPPVRLRTRGQFEEVRKITEDFCGSPVATFAMGDGRWVRQICLEQPLSWWGEGTFVRMSAGGSSL